MDKLIRQNADDVHRYERQPILNRLGQVVAYELLFRSGQRSVYDAPDGDEATVPNIYLQSLQWTEELFNQTLR
ncbi:hypothetical protein [Propionispora hippei]|uniref:Uncharacterized protein n=1 Tax=Propionispora hippei DSM 15287 TaxID=1123003 RepID=A0A1M6F147_9FIRM|nr:hypothetical protein [Propionispora hippei]SHI91385.1 hypothetical protein SAMN02745170_01327 [Propionispora hippei DSM 15287]